MKDEEVIRYLELMDSEIDFKKLGFVYANEALNIAIQKIKEGILEDTLQKIKRRMSEHADKI